MVSAVLSTGLANAPVTCASNEYLNFQPLAGQTCQQYLNTYQQTFGGYVENPDATQDCSFCQVATTNVFLNQINANYGDRWRNFGILWAYVIFNVVFALVFYYFGRMPKGAVKKDKKGKKKEVEAVEEKAG